MTIRPTADKQRESLFNILAETVIGATVLDLYAGTGAMGIEALSRGAQSVVFIDNDLQSMRLIKENIRSFQIESSSQVIHWNILKNLSCLKDHVFDLILMDPPYHHAHVQTTLSHLLNIHCLNEQTLIVAEHAVSDNILIPKEFIQYDSRRYGKTQLSFFASFSSVRAISAL